MSKYLPVESLSSCVWCHGSAQKEPQGSSNIKSGNRSRSLFLSLRVNTTGFSFTAVLFRESGFHAGSLCFKFLGGKTYLDSSWYTQSGCLLYSKQ